MSKAAGQYAQAADIKVGVIGYGGSFNMGRQHLNEMKAAGMTPTAVAELDPARLKVAQEEFPGIETYRSVAAMLKKSAVDLVTIITPHNTHAKLAIQCLKAGRHVVTEKPFAISTAQCDRMIAEAGKQGRMLSTYHNRHWDGCILAAAEQIRAGAIGNIVRIAAKMGGYWKPGDIWRSSKSLSGGVLFDWGVHLLEYSLQLIDAPIVEVSGFAHNGLWASQCKWGADTNEDEGVAIVRFQSGQWLSLCISHLDSVKSEHWLAITGDKGAYLFNGKTWKMIRQVDGQACETAGDNPPGRGGSFYRNVAAHLTKKEPLVITPEWARRPIHILDLACRSAAQGRTLRARYP